MSGAAVSGDLIVRNASTPDHETVVDLWHRRPWMLIQRVHVAVMKRVMVINVERGLVGVLCPSDNVRWSLHFHCGVDLFACSELVSRLLWLKPLVRRHFASNLAVPRKAISALVGYSVWLAGPES